MEQREKEVIIKVLRIMEARKAAGVRMRRNIIYYEDFSEGYRKQDFYNKRRGQK